MFLDGPSGILGSLPMTVEGNIHLEDGYNLVGYTTTVDAKNVLGTFEIEKFVSVVGEVKGEYDLKGPREESIISGWVISARKNAVFDKLPLDDARMEFTWDSVAVVLDFTSIEANVTGGGMIMGVGSMFFDMKKACPYGMSRKVHHERNPKALYWIPESNLPDIPPIIPPPEEIMEKDEQAPFRKCDSIRFDFQVRDVNGGMLLKNYGGEYGALAINSVGVVSGEGVLAGHLKDANYRAVWRSTSAHPQIRLRP